MSLASCGPDSILPAGLTDLAGKDLINKFEDSANRLLADAAQTGNALEANAGERIHVATQNLAIALDGQLDKAVGRLQTPEQQLILAVNQVVQEASNLKSNVMTVEQMTNLDLIEESNRINLLTKKVEYYVSSVGGLTAIPGEGDHVVSVLGIGFGYDDSSNTYEVSASFNGSPLATDTLSRPDNHTLQIRIPDALIRPLYMQSSVSRVPFSLHSTVRPLNHPESTGHTYVTNFDILLLPIVGGTISVVEEIANHHLDGKTLTHDMTVQVPKSKPDQPFNYSDTWRCADNETIVGCTYDGTGAGFPFCYPPAGAGKPDFTISDGGHLITVGRHCDGPDAVFTHHVQYQTMTVDYTKAAPRSQSINLGAPVAIVLSDLNERRSYTITGTTITGQTISIDSNSVTNPGNMLKLVGAGPINGHWQIDFSFSLP